MASEPHNRGRGEPLSPERRRLLARLSIAAGAVAATIVGVPILGFIIGPLLRKTPETWRALGPLKNFAIGETVKVSFRDPTPLAWAGITAETGAWLRRDSQSGFTAFALTCTHLGCPVRWLDKANLFMCPCHGGVYYRDGAVAGGPPPRPLFRYAVRINGGQVEILAGPVKVG
ncbi:MAG: ubiquinol-cytochrome c reductase iron-sulfur subunit [Candidatus Binataceae bacterium]